MAAISCLYFGSLPFYKDWINVRLRLCYCCSALSDTDSELGNFRVVTGKDDNCSGFSNAKFAIRSACRLSCLVTRERVHRVKALPHVTISSTMVFNMAKIASARASSTISLTKSLRVAGP